MSQTKTEVALVSLPTLPAELENKFIDDDFIDGLIKEVREKASSEVGDVKTAKGRAVYISMAAKVRSAKAMIDDAGKTLVAEMKKRPALVDASRRKVREALDALAIEIRKPVTDWEEEQAQIKADKEAEEERKWQEAEEKRQAEQLAQQKEAAHEMALLENIIFDRDLADRLAEQERQRIENEERIRREAAAQAIKDEQDRHQAELAAAVQRENEAKEALAKAERDKQEAIERANREAQAKEDARLAEEKRIKEESDARVANVAHQAVINNAAIKVLTDAGISSECAKASVIAIIKKQLANNAAGIHSVIQLNY